MGAIETIAWIFVVAGLLKIVILLVNPKSYMNFSKEFMKIRGLKVIYLILAGVVFYYLVQNGFNIVQILAVGAFMSLLIGAQMMGYSKELMSLSQKILKNKKDFWTRNWFIMLVWIFLLITGLIALIG